MSASAGTLDELGGMRLLDIQARTRFELGEAGRLVAENSPDRSPAPRLWLAGSAEGNAVWFRADVPEEIVEEVSALVAEEPALIEPESVPVHLDEYTTLLAADTPVEEVSHDITYTIPHDLAYEGDVRIVSSDTDEGDALLAHMEADGMHEGLREMGFTDPTHLWPPWSVVLEDEEVASIAFTARLSSEGAELGVATPPSFRRRGYARVTTAAWAALPELAERVLFYSTELTNIPSRGLASQLGLPFLGAGLSVS